MTGNGAVLDFSRPFPDGDGIYDLAARVFKDTRVLRAAYAAFGSQVPHQLFLQHSAGLDEQAAVNRFVGHAHALVIGKLDLQPSRNLFRRPIQKQFTRNHLPQFHMKGKKAPLGPQGRVPGSLIRFIGSILRTATMTCHLPAHRRRGALQTLSDITNRRTGSHSSRDLFSFRQGKGEQPTPTQRLNDPTVMRQQTVNGGMRPVKGAPNRMQRLSRSPAAPHVSPLSHRKLYVFPLRHIHHLGRKIYIRWCCIDLLNAPPKSEKWVLVRTLPVSRLERPTLRPESDGWLLGAELRESICAGLLDYTGPNHKPVVRYEERTCLCCAHTRRTHSVTPVYKCTNWGRSAPLI